MSVQWRDKPNRSVNAFMKTYRLKTLGNGVETDGTTKHWKVLNADYYSGTFCY
jgi:hypothetical protein